MENLDLRETTLIILILKSVQYRTAHMVINLSRYHDCTGYVSYTYAPFITFHASWTVISDK